MAALPDYSTLLVRHHNDVRAGSDPSINGGVAIAHHSAREVAIIKAVRPIAAAYGRNTALAPRSIETDRYLYMLHFYGYA
jgi:hypothetical protein